MKFKHGVINMGVINMEVRIKQGNEMLDATIEMVDGVMVVSPQVDEFDPKDGDVVAINEGSQIFVCKEYLRDGGIYAYFGWDLLSNVIFDEGEWDVDRYATFEEKRKLFDKLKENGLSWDAEKKEVVKIKWKPKCDENYYAPWIDVSNSDEFFCDHLYWDNDPIDEELYDRGWCFKTEEDCQSFCDKLNQAIKSVKP